MHYFSFILKPILKAKVFQWAQAYKGIKNKKNDRIFQEVMVVSQYLI